MAEAVQTSPSVQPTLSPIDKSKILCRYFQHGVCRQGESCLYSHDFSDRPNNVCTFYLAGNCSYGSACRYDHIRPRPSPEGSLQSQCSPGSMTSPSNSLSNYHTSLVSSNGVSSGVRGATLSVSPRHSGSANRASPRNRAAANNAVAQSSDATSSYHSATTFSKSCAQPHRTVTALSPNCHLGAASSNMVKLKKPQASSASGSFWEASSARGLNVKAQEFVPKLQFSSQEAAAPPLSYLDVAQTGLVLPGGDDSWNTSQNGAYLGDEFAATAGTGELCPYAAHGECRFGESCPYVHGDICDMCGFAVLSLVDKDQRAKHAEECIREHEKDMELSFAIQRSKDKVCGICMDLVWDKQPPSEQRFGILSSCSHVFCLTCIRRWRAAKQFERKIVRACPECRCESDFVTPSKYWVEDKADKDALIDSYKQALGKKPCKYFNEGNGECPFNEKCFYLHAYKDGTIASPRAMRRRRRWDAENEPGVVRQLILWEVLQEINDRRGNSGAAAEALQDIFDEDDLDDYYVQLDFGMFGSRSSDEEENSETDDDD